jgi:hypothetical protein
MNFINIIDIYGYDVIFSGVQVPDGIDTETLINSIIDKCGTSEPLYTDMPLLEQKITVWFKKYRHSFERLYRAYMADYNAIHNYDRYEEIDNDNNRKASDLLKVSPYDTDRFINDSNTDRTENINNKHRAHIYGNIGVTTAPQMLREELNIVPALNFYNVVSDLFYDEFFIKVM